MASVLIAEDEAAVREFVSRALATDGHRVTAVGDGGQALEALAKEPFDVMLADIVMPVMDGIALALKAARDFPAMPVVLMTGYAPEKERAHNLDRLIFEVVPKPFTLAEICTVIARALDSRPPV